MPVYVFTCGACGRFEESRPMAQAGDAAACPTCRGRAQRVFTPPHLPVLAAGVRRALSAEDASAHEPRVVGEKRGRPMPQLATSSAPSWALSGH